MNSTDSKRMIFYIPAPWDPVARPSASQIRPQKMLHAFKARGYEVDEVFGTARERKEKIVGIQTKMTAGIRYDFCYIESSTMPTLLTESHHLPTHPLLDYGFWWRLKRKKIPIGIFYRDIYWKFPEYRKKLGLMKAFVGNFFYYLDLLSYFFLMNCLFLPSMKMAQYLPVFLRRRVCSLPPGGDDPGDAAFTSPYSGGTLRILYVGGVGEHYGLGESLRTCNDLDFVELTLCVRHDEWEKSELKKIVSTLNRIRVVHFQGRELATLYRNSHASLLTFDSSMYRSFAMPFKLFEAISYRVPVIAVEGTAAADFVREHQFGFVIKDSGPALNSKLRELHDHPTLIANVRKSVEAGSRDHLWIQRVANVEKALEIE